MKAYHRQIAANLLKYAAETFHNHGCNDFTDEIFENVPEDEQGKFKHELAQWMDPGEYERDPWEGDHDAFAMEMLAEIIETDS